MPHFRLTARDRESRRYRIMGMVRGGYSYEFATGLRPTPLNETFGVGVDRLFCGRRRRGGRFLYGAAEPVFELDPGRLDHPHWSQGAATPPEHVV
jgi:hypothetical protein